MRTRIAVAAAVLMLAAGAHAAEYRVESFCTIFGGKWQVNSDARSNLLLASGVKAGFGNIGHTHILWTTAGSPSTMASGIGTASSSLSKTAGALTPLPNGCNEASVSGYSTDGRYPADPGYAVAGSLCFTSNFTSYQYYDSAGSSIDDGRESPIIFDLTGHGYRLTSHKGGVQFDIRNDGKPIQIAWTDGDSGNAFLALDRNGNGTIDSGAELFGSRTPLNGGGVGPTGFHALADLDTNHDFLVDNLDAAWSSLLLWTDRDHDGASTQDELQHLADSAITALEFDFHRVGREDKWGNDFRLMSHARFGSERRSYYDVWLLTR